MRGWSTRRSTSFSTSRFVCRCSCRLLWETLLFLIGISRRATITTLCIEGITQLFQVRLPIGIYTGYSFMSPANFGRCVPSDMKTKGSCVSATLSIDLTSIRTLLSSSISPYLGLPPPVCCMHFGIKAFRLRKAVKATLRGAHQRLSIRWLLHQPSDAFDDFSTPAFNKAFVMVISTHNVKSVYFPLLESLIVWHASYEVLDTILACDAWEMQCDVFFFQHFVVVCLHALLLGPKLDIHLLSTFHKQVQGIVL